MSNDTGRIKVSLDDELKNLVFGVIDEHLVNTELRHYADIDIVHVSMLYRQGIIQKNTAAKIISQVKTLIESDFKCLLGVNADRGTYLAYERYIVDNLGISVGGMIQAGRSRNDLNATVFKLNARSTYARSMIKLITFVEHLDFFSNKYRAAVFPLFTHMQTAFPSTFGHYLSGFRDQLNRNLKLLDNAYTDIDSSPLGACAGGGTTFPVDRAYTAENLGFTTIVRNSIDAVSSRDVCTNVLTSNAILATTLSRLISDLLFWSSDQIMLVELPDELVGSSSIMPQKRNPFLLELAKGKCSRVISYSTGFLSTIQDLSFSNSAVVSANSLNYLDDSVNDILFVLKILTKVLSGLSLSNKFSEKVLESGMTDAVFFAEKICLGGNVSFRDAHHVVGEKVTDAINQDVPLRTLLEVSSFSTSDWFDHVSGKFKYGGGCSDSFNKGKCDDIKKKYFSRVNHWNEATLKLKGISL